MGNKNKTLTKKKETKKKSVVEKPKRTTSKASYMLSTKNGSRINQKRFGISTTNKNVYALINENLEKDLVRFMLKQQLIALANKKKQITEKHAEKSFIKNNEISSIVL
jgi:hypothetical protein